MGLPRWRRAGPVVGLLALCLVGGPLAARSGLARAPAFRVELGTADDRYRAGGELAWSRAYRDSGPFRLRRGERWMTHFAARIARPGAALRLPAVVAGGDGELRLRVHRYGRPGAVHVLANGVRVGTLDFRRDSYPWDVRRVRLPAGVAAASSVLALDFVAEGAPPLEDGGLVALDFVELAPAEETARLRPTFRQGAFAALVAFSVGAFALLAGLSGPVSFAAAVATLGAIGWAYARMPGIADNATATLPVVFLAGALLAAILEGTRLRGVRGRRLAAAATFLVAAHGTVIFLPRHLPPDLGPHLGQVRRLERERLDGKRFWELSSSFGETGRGKPHFGADYEAPYPPWTYFLVHGLRRLADWPQIWLELLGLFAAGLLVVFVYVLAGALAADARAPTYAAALMALDLSSWHHALRAHVPGLLGQVVLLAALTELVLRGERLEGRRGFLRFALLAAAATLAYTATLFHFVLFVAWLAALDGLERRRLAPRRETARLVGAAAAGTLASFGLFYWRFVGPALAAKDAILAEGGYRAPARFFFLRNQMRDTVRILRFGYPLWVGLALPALLRLRAWSKGAFARRVLLAWTATYATLLVLKDPLFLPQVFLHAKEDLLFAPAAAILGGMTLARLARLPRIGRAATAAVLGLALLLHGRDVAFNADTIGGGAVPPPADARTAP